MKTTAKAIFRSRVRQSQTGESQLAILAPCLLLASVRYSVICALVSGLLVMSEWASVANAQTDSPSHRLLPLPQGENSDLSSQAMLLRQLRSLMNQQSSADDSRSVNSGADSSSTDNRSTSPSGSDSRQPAVTGEQKSEISLDQLQQLQKSLHQFSDVLPPGLLPQGLDSLPEEQKQQIDQALRDPERQRQLRQMLEQFAQDGRLPQSQQTANEAPPLPLPPQNSSRAGNQSGPVNPAEPIPPFEQGRNNRGDDQKRNSSTSAMPPTSEDDNRSLNSGALDSTDQSAPTGPSENGSSLRPRASLNPGASQQPSSAGDRGARQDQSARTPAASGQEPGPKSLQDLGQNGFGDGRSPRKPDGREGAADQTKLPSSPSADESSQSSGFWESLGLAKKPNAGFGEQQSGAAASNADELPGSTDSTGSAPGSSVASPTGVGLSEPQPGRATSADGRPQSATQPQFENLPSITPGRSGVERNNDGREPSPTSGSPGIDGFQSSAQPDGRVMDPDQLKRMQDLVKNWLQENDRQSQSRNQPAIQARPGDRQLSGSPSNSGTAAGGNTLNNEPSGFRPGPSGTLPTDQELEEVRRQLKSIQESMTQTPKQRSDSPTIQPSAPERTSPSAAANQSSQSSAVTQNSNTSPDTNNNQPDEVDVKRELQQRGFRGTLQKLVEKARKEVTSDDGNSTASATNTRPAMDAGSVGKAGDTVAENKASGGQNESLERSLIRTLDGLREDIVEMAQDARQKSEAQTAGPSPPTFRDRPDNSSRDSNRSGRPNSSLSTEEGSLSRLRKGAADLFSGIAKAPTQADEKITTGSSKDIVSDTAGDSSLMMVVVSIFVIVGILIILMALGARQTGLWTKDGESRINGTAVRPHEIRTRQDVVKAFHQLTGRRLNPSLSPVEAWWTHRDAARQISLMSPPLQNAVHVLADVYEQARYLPGDYQLSDDQLSDVRDALSQCEKGVR